jgi:hypothetical protein
MTKTWLAAAAALAMMTGGALAQSMTTSSSTSTESTVAAPVPVPGVVSASSSQQTVDSNGVETDKTQTYSNGTTINPSGDVSTTRRTTDTTTTH